MFRFPLSKQENRISPQEVKQRLEDESALVLLDVRTPQEYAEKHVPGSVNLPLDSLNRISGLVPKKDTSIIVYCASGARSAAAAAQLIKMGYTGVTDMGGINAWPYATEKSR